jgi:hypothetical protein
MCRKGGALEKLGCPGKNGKRNIGRPRKFSWATMIRLAHCRVRNHTAIAKLFNCSKTLVGQMQVSTANAYKVSQDQVARIIMQLRYRPPHFSTGGGYFDETGQPVTLALPGLAETKHTSSTVWQVMVIKKRFVFGWITRSPAYDGKGNQDVKTLVMFFDFVCGPLPLISTGYDDIYNAVECHPAIEGSNVLSRFLEDTTLKRHHRVRGFDGATGCDKYWHVMTEMLKKPKA